VDNRGQNVDIGRRKYLRGRLRPPRYPPCQRTFVLWTLLVFSLSESLKNYIEIFKGRFALNLPTRTRPPPSSATREQYREAARLSSNAPYTYGTGPSRSARGSRRSLQSQFRGQNGPNPMSNYRPNILPPSRLHPKGDILPKQPANSPNFSG
jgi:hypothetical protein